MGPQHSKAKAKAKPSTPPPRPTWGPFAIPTGPLDPPTTAPKAPKREKPSKPDYPHPTSMDVAKSPPKKPASLPESFRAPPATDILGDVPPKPPGPPLRERDRVRVEQFRHELLALKKVADAAIAKRQDEAFRGNVARDVSAMAGLADAPFGGLGGGGPAKPAHTYTPDLTDQVALARSRRERLAQGGLLTPEQQNAHDMAAIGVDRSTKPTFEDTHQLPWAAARGFTTHAPAPQPAGPPPPPRDFGGGKGGAFGPEAQPRENPRLQMQRNQPGQSHDTLSRAFDLGQDESWRTALENVTSLGEGRSWGTSFDKTVGSAIDALNPWGDPKNLTTDIRDIGKPGKGKTIQQAISGVANAGLSFPHDLRFDPRDLRVSTPAAVASDGKVPADVAAAIGFSPKKAEELRGKALKRGWHKQEIDGLAGADLLTHAYSDPPAHGLRELQNFGIGAAQTSAFFPGVVGLGKELAFGDHRAATLDQLAGALKHEGLNWITDPWNTALSEPFSVVPAVGAAGKTAGLIGHVIHAGAEMPLREIRTGMYRGGALTHLPDVEGKPQLGPTAPELVYRRGQLDKNLWTQIGQRISDSVAANHRLNALHARHFDNQVRLSINEAAHGHVKRQVAYRDAVRGLEGRMSAKKKRAEDLLTVYHHGGKSEDIKRFYEDKIASGEPLTGAEAGQVKYLTRIIEMQKNLSEADHTFIDAARELDRHTSATHVELGRFRRSAVLYRSMEPLIEAALARGKRLTNPAELTPEIELADQIAELRKMVLYPPDARNAPLDSARVAPRAGKISEATRHEGKGFAWYQAEYDKALAAAPGPAPVDAGAAAHEAAMAAHKAAAPRKPPKGPQGDFATKGAAHTAGKAVRDKHGATGVRIRESSPGHFTWELIFPKGHTAASPEVLAYRARLKKFVAKNPKPTHPADLAAWEAKKPKPPLTPHAKAVMKHKAKEPVRNPAELAAHAEALRKHAVAVRAHKRKVAAALNAMNAHKKNWGSAHTRKANLKAAETEQWRRVTDPVAIHAHYQQALEQFLQMHLDSGGLEPGRVAYSKPHLRSVIPAAVRGGARINFKSDARRSPRVDPSTGRTFKGGNYLVDANSPIRESVHAQRLRVGLGMHQLIVDQVAQLVPDGTHVGKDQVAVTVGNLRTLAKAEHVMDDNKVSHQASYEAERGLRQSRLGELMGMAEQGGADVTTNGDSYLIPKAAWERMLDWTRPVSKNRYDKVMREYQRALISIFPGTVIGNTVGSLPLAFAAGAGPRSFRMAERTMHHGGAGRDLAANYLYGKGPSGSLERDSGNIVLHGMNKMRGASIQGEDFSRVAAYWSKALPIVRREGKRIQQESERLRAEWEKKKAEFVGPKPPKAEPHVSEYRPLQHTDPHASHNVPHPVTRHEPDWGVPPEVLDAEQAFEHAARQFAAGKLRPDLLNEVLDHVEKFMGDTHRPLGRLGRGVQATHVILFQNWVMHMAKLVLWTLPVKHPRRMLFINTMARYGDQYRKEHGAWPGWMIGFLPIMHQTARVPGLGNSAAGRELQHWTHVISLMNLSPQSTGGGLAQSLTDDKNFFDRVAGVSNPIVQAGRDLQKLTDKQKGLAADQKVDMPRALLNAALGLVPGERKFFPQQGMLPDSLPGSPRYKTYTDQVTGQLRSPFLFPGVRVDHGWLGDLERVFGFGGYQVPNQGPIWEHAQAEQDIRNIPHPESDINAQIRAQQRRAMQGDARRASNGP